MLDKSRQYPLKCALIAFVFCETLLISGSAKPLFPRNNKKWVVVIDAGHGGKDPGCHGVKFKEKDVALSVALKLGRLLQENDKNVTVVYTRKTDVFIPLNERADIANRNHADFFICVHCNASPDKTKYGAATYVMGLYKAEGNLEVSKRENSSILYEKDYKQTYNGFDPNSEEANILFAMYQNAYLAQSLNLSEKIQKEYSGDAKRTDNGVKQAGFLVLWKTTMPSLLSEIGFLTNPEEENFIGSQKGQNKIAECLFFALQQYIDEKEGTTFNSSDFKLKASQVDTVAADDTAVEMPDTTAKTVKIIDTNNGKDPAKTSHPPDLKTSKNTTTPKDADKIKQSMKALHPDSAKSSVVKKTEDTAAPHINHVVTEKKNDTTKHVAVIKKGDSTNHHYDHIVTEKKKDVTTNVPVKTSDDTSQLIYKVQFALSPKPLATTDAKFKGMPNVEMYEDKSMYKYTSGHFLSLADAVALQTQIRNQGFKDAFVVAFKGKNRVPIPRK